jgi:hypothetical protein
MKRECKYCNSKIKIEFSKIPDYGDLMTIEDFLEHLDKGWFMDYDGSGYYGFKDKRANYKFDINNYKIFGEYDKRFTHVVWFNK